MRIASGIGRRLRSPALAVTLLIALAAAAALASALAPVAPSDPEAPPPPERSLTVRVLGLDRPFSSPVFLGLVALLAVNVALCTVHRSRGGALRARGLRGATDLAIHASLLLLLCGGAAKGALGRVLTQHVAVGSETATMYDWRTGRDEPLGHTLRIESFREERYPLQVAVGIRDRVTGDKLALVELREGRRAKVPGTGLELADGSFEPSTGIVSVTVRSPRGLERLGFPTRAGEEKEREVGDHRFALVAWRSEVKAARAEASILSGGVAVARGVLEPNGRLGYGGTSYYLTAWGTDRFGIPFCGIQAARDPGAPLFWAGCVLLVLATPLHLLARRRRGTPGPPSGGVDAAGG